MDHVLVLNRHSIEVQSGNFSSWWENKERADQNAKMENEKHLKEIGKLKAAADRSARWADKNNRQRLDLTRSRSTIGVFPPDHTSVQRQRKCRRG